MDILLAILEAERGNVFLRQLNVDQKAECDCGTAALIDPRPSAKMFFFKCPGGTGKTTLYSCLMSGVVRPKKERVGSAVHRYSGRPLGWLKDSALHLWSAVRDTHVHVHIHGRIAVVEGAQDSWRLAHRLGRGTLVSRVPVDSHRPTTEMHNAIRIPFSW